MDADDGGVFLRRLGPVIGGHAFADGFIENAVSRLDITLAGVRIHEDVGDLVDVAGLGEDVEDAVDFRLLLGIHDAVERVLGAGGRGCIWKVWRSRRRPRP